jgi:hypothetical protein
MIESAKRGVQHSIDAEPAHRPGVGVRVSRQSATSMHEPGMLFAVHVGAALAGCASPIAGGMHIAASAVAATSTTAASWLALPE